MMFITSNYQQQGQETTSSAFPHHGRGQLHLSLRIFAFDLCPQHQSAATPHFADVHY
jgi:hypothetical protein